VGQCVQFYAFLCVTRPSEVFVMNSGPAVVILEAGYWTDGRRMACADDSHCLPSKLIHKIFYSRFILVLVLYIRTSSTSFITILSFIHSSYKVFPEFAGII
jgi:hypothetical protein